MLKKISDLFAGVKLTIIAGIFLVFSLVLLLTGKSFIFDPAWITVIISGYPLVYLAVTRLVQQKWISSALLISIAMLASLAIGELFAAGEVAFIMSIGAILEDMTVARAQKGLTNLISLTPTTGRKLIRTGDSFMEEMIPASAIAVSDLLRILPGEVIPSDGRIIAGNTAVDQSIMTGESLPVDKSIDEPVFCGTLNCFGAIDIEATSAAEDSSLKKLIRMVQEAEDKKAPMQRIVDQWAVWLVPIALGIAIAAFLFLWLSGAELMTALNRGVTVLVVFCPCALALATPTSIIAAIGQAAKHGVIIKSGEALEKMGKVDTIAFDKTGTLTFGKPEVSDIISFDQDPGQQNKLLLFTASAEAKSEHPLGKAITAYARDSGLSLVETTDFMMNAGRGITAKINGKQILCGSEKYLLAHGIGVAPEYTDIVTNLRNQGKAVILTAYDSTCMGALGLSDRIRPEAREMVEKLTAMNTNVVLLTGDNKRIAAYFASQAGITSVQSELLPEDKVNSITGLQAADHRVCMIGDGVNDAPALKTADVGVAMGSMGSDIAVEAADIALMSDDIAKIPYLKRLSRSTLNTIKGNITASMCLNALAITLSVLGVLNPVTGALVHNAGSVLIVLNAVLLYDRKM